MMKPKPVEGFGCIAVRDSSLQTMEQRVRFSPSKEQPFAVNHAHMPISQLYLLGEIGHIFAYTTYPANFSAQPLITCLGITVGDTPINVEIDGKRYSGPVCLAAPRTSTIEAHPIPTVTFAFYPATTTHRAMLMLPEPRVKILEREIFRALDPLLIDASSGRLSIADAHKLFHGVVACCSPFLPAPAPLDRRVELAARTLYADPRIDVDTLAQMAGLSADRLSHLFTEVIGIDLRKYRVWLKMGRATLLFNSPRALTLAEVAEHAGFSDASHLSRAFKETYGGAPSNFLANIKIHGSASS